MDIGYTPAPETGREQYAALGVIPAFTRAFAKPGAGLDFRRDVLEALPPGCQPWYSHKDPVLIDKVTAYWNTLPGSLTGRRVRWTYFHESAPGTFNDRQAYHTYWSSLKAAATDFPHVELVQIQSNYAMRWRRDTRWTEWMIPDVAVGFDCYPLAGFRYEPPESMFGLLRQAAIDYNCPAWGVPELGAEFRPGQSRNLWYIECADYLKSAGADFLGFWASHEKRDNMTYDYRPDEALRGAIALIIKENAA